MNIHGLVVLVTGASSGIGAATAQGIRSESGPPDVLINNAEAGRFLYKVGARNAVDTGPSE